MAVGTPPVNGLPSLRAPDGRPALEISHGHPYFTGIDKTLKPSQGGPGMFESRRDPATGQFRLYAALVPVTRVQRDPENEERTIDVPMVDEEGRVLMQRDPAARTTIALAHDLDETVDSIPTTPFPDTKEPVMQSIDSLKEVIVEQNRLASERFSELVGALTDALKGRT